MARMAGALIGIGLLGCQTESPELVSNGATIQPTVSAVVVAADADATPNRVVVRAVDFSGVSIGGQPVSVEIDGTTTSLEVDALGYAIVEVAAGSTRIGDVDVHTFEAASDLPALPRVESVRPTAIEAVTGRRGYLANTGTQIWWTGPDLPDHPVVDLAVPVRGLRAGQFDGDGVVDAIVWGGDRVVLLRGRDEGGAGFGAGIVAEGWTVLAAAAGDLNDDGDVDLAIAWDVGGGTVLQAWLGDGAYAFTPADELTLVDPPIDMAISTARSDGEVVLTALIAGAPWIRYRFLEGGWAGTGGQIQMDVEPGSRLFHADLTGDDRDELLVVGPRREGAVRTVQTWDLGSSDNPTLLPMDVPGGEVTLADADADGVTDLWLLEDNGSLAIVFGTGGEFRRDDAGVLEATGPIALSETNDDTLKDLFVASGDAWQRFVGRPDDQDQRWRPQRPSVTRRNLNLASPLVPVEADSTVDEFATIALAGDWMTMRTLALGSRGPVQATDVRLRPETVEVIDLAACGSDVWALLSDEVVHIDAAAGVVVGRSPIASGVAIACQSDQDPPAALLTQTEIVELTRGAALGAASTTSATDLTFVDGSIASCASPCVTWPSPDGDIQVEASADETLIMTGGAPTLLETGGQLAVQDSDGDGEPELWSRDATGRIRVVRRTEAGPVVEAWMWTSPIYAGAPWLGAAPDGSQAVWFHDETDILWMP